MSAWTTTLIQRMGVELKDRVLNALRACRSSEELVALDEQLAIDHRECPLHRLICDGLRERTVAPVEAANWLMALMEHREQQLTACLNLSCQV